MTEPRMRLPDVASEAYKALSAVEAYLRRSGLETPLMELVKLRASQINGCAFCLAMHSRDARSHGETEQRIYLLNGWRDAPLYTERERAALAWTEHLTRVATEGAPAPAYAALQRCFTDKEIADLTVLVGMINLWNRLMIGFAVPPQVAA